MIGVLSLTIADKGLVEILIKYVDLRCFIAGYLQGRDSNLK